MNTKLLTLVLAATAGLAACGGGGGHEPAAPAEVEAVPASATVDARSYTQFVGSLKAVDDREPLPLDKLVPPGSDGDEPLPVSG